MTHTRQRTDSMIVYVTNKNLEGRFSVVCVCVCTRARERRFKFAANLAPPTMIGWVVSAPQQWNWLANDLNMRK